CFHYWMRTCSTTLSLHDALPISTGCSTGSIASSFARSPWITALACTISVYRRACGASRRWNTRHQVSVQSIIGATDRRKAAGSIMAGLGGRDGWAETGIRPVYRSIPVATLGLALVALVGLVPLVVAFPRVVVAMQRPRPALVHGRKPVLQAMELVRTRLDAHALGQGAPALPMVALPLLGDVAAGAADDLGDGAGVVHVARRPALLHEQRGDVIARGAVVAHELVDERFAVAAAIGIDVAQGLVDPDVAGAGIPSEHEILRACAADRAGKSECEDDVPGADFHRDLQWFFLHIAMTAV